MKIRVFQKGFNYSQDGTGNRIVYHLQGCNMRCPWCANPEGISIDGTLIVNHDLLIDSVCPYGAIREKQLDRHKCADCRTKECINRNKNLGIRLSCEEYDIDLIIYEVKHSSALFYSGGGVTFTGGEPTMQFDVVRILLEKIKQNGINTAIESNATHYKLDRLFPLVDLLIMDFKHYNDELHTGITGVSNSIIKENLCKAFSLHKNVLIRIPIIKGFNDSEKDICEFVRFFKQHNTEHVAFEFLPYHEYGKVKWLQCGLYYNMKASFPEPEILNLYKTGFESENLEVVHT